MSLPMKQRITAQPANVILKPLVVAMKDGAGVKKKKYFTFKWDNNTGIRRRHGIPHPIRAHTVGWVRVDFKKYIYTHESQLYL